MKMRKCILLLPTTFNGGAEVPAETLGSILADIDKAFDGHTVDGLCDGAYRMRNGEMANDRCLKVWVAVDPDRVDELKRLAARFAKRLKQESLYFEVTEAEIEFVRSMPEDGEAA